MSTLATAIQDLRSALDRHAHECDQPVSCTDAAQTHQRVVETQARLARIMAGCQAHMTSEERRLLGLTPSRILVEALMSNPVHCYRVWFHYADERPSAYYRVHLYDATSPDEAMTMLERAYEGVADIVVAKIEDLTSGMTF